MSPPLLRFALALLAAALFAPAQAAEPAALPPPSLPVAVYLTWQRDPVTTMTVHWHTDWKNGFADSVLEYRAAKTGATDAAWTRAQGRAIQMPFTDRMIHTVELTGLQGDSSYEFRLGRLLTREADGAMLFHPHGPTHLFRTLPATLSRPLRFVSGGDIYGRGYGEVMAAMCRAAAATDPEFVVLGGDIAYVDNRPGGAMHWFEFFRTWGETMIAPGGHLIPIVPAIGNHEAHGDTYATGGGSPHRGVSPDRAIFFYSLFSFPGRPGYNVLDAGTYLSLVSLDSFHTNPVPGAQTDWLRSTLAQRRHVTHVVPFYHVPAYPSHRSFAGPVSVAIRANWVPLFDEARIPFVFENHDHTYKVTFPLRGGQPHPDGTRYLGDGAWAVATRAITPPDKAPYLERAHPKNHVIVVTLHPDRADISAIDPTGEEFDRFSIPARN